MKNQGRYYKKNLFDYRRNRNWFYTIWLLNDDVFIYVILNKNPDVLYHF